MTRAAFKVRRAPSGREVIVDETRGTGAHYYVHATLGDDNNDGDSPSEPMATLQAAINLCVAANGDCVWLMPGHAESIINGTVLDANEAGISIRGIGNGEQRPIITFTTATSALFTISANNVLLSNIVFKNDIDSQVIMLDVNGADCTLEDLELREGSAKQALIYIDVAGDRCKIRRVKLTATTAGATSGIKLSAAKDGIVIEDCVIDGDFDDAAIHNPGATVCTNLFLRNNTVRNRQTGDHAIELVSACTGAAVDNKLFGDTSGTIFDPGSLFLANNYESAAIDTPGGPSPPAAGADTAANILGADNNNNAFASTNVAANRDGSIIERLEHLLDALVDDEATNLIGFDDADNSGATTNVVGNKDGTILERLEDITQELSGAVGIASFPTGAAPANNISLAEVIRAIYNQTLNASKNATAVNYFTVTADMTSATWNTAASHEIATVTGMVRMRVIIQCTGTLTDAADGASIQFGIEGSTAALIGSTGAAGAGGNTIETNEFWVDTSPAELVLTAANQNVLDFVVGGGLDVGYEITGAALTGGTLIFHVWYEPLDATGAVAAGAGGSL